MRTHSVLNGDDLIHTRWVKRDKMDQLADTALAAAAVEAIETLTTVPLESIKVTAHNGWLRLEGTVDWQHQRTTVEEVTRNLVGVEGVKDLIRVNSL